MFDHVYNSRTCYTFNLCTFCQMIPWSLACLQIATIISHRVIWSLIIIYKYPTNYPVIYYLLIRRAWDEYFYYY